MNQTERRLLLIRELMKEQPRWQGMRPPEDVEEQRNLLRSLMNVRPPQRIDEDLLAVQDAYLRQETAEKGITDIAELIPVEEGIFLWQGDITTLRCSAIVNAANAGMTGCYIPCHRCIDNAIHTYAGMQLRLACAKLMEEQGHEEPTGQAKITPAYNLPCDYVLHTVGPIVHGRVTDKERNLLASCYRSCLELARQHDVNSIAFCCISTGEFHFPNEEAAEIAVRTVREYREETGGRMKVVFNVFKELDRAIYARLLGGD